MCDAWQRNWEGGRGHFRGGGEDMGGGRRKLDVLVGVVMVVVVVANVLLAGGAVAEGGREMQREAWATRIAAASGPLLRWVRYYGTPPAVPGTLSEGLLRPGEGEVVEALEELEKVGAEADAAGDVRTAGETFALRATVWEEAPVRMVREVEREGVVAPKRPVAGGEEEEGREVLRLWMEAAVRGHPRAPVSYTHLTLPTMRIV